MTVSMATLMLAVAGCASMPPATPTPSPLSDLPPTFQPGHDEMMDETLHAQGDMRYTCVRVDAASTRSSGFTAYSWKPVGTVAQLLDDNSKTVALVTPEGYYTAYDGSYVAAHVNETFQPDPQALPWTREAIRFRAASSEGGGRFAHTTAIVRTHTIGGLTPAAPCDQEGISLAVPYFATYLAYRRANGASTADTSRAMPLEISAPISITAP